MIPGVPFSAPMYGAPMSAPPMGPPGLTASPPPTGSRPRFDTSFVDGKCFIGGLDLSTDKDRLAEYCSQWGELSDVVVMSGRGFGFATFADPQNATAFLANKDHLIDGRRVEVKAALPRGQQAPHPAQNQSVVLGKIFVGGTGDLQEPDLRDYFSQFGEITDAVVVSHPDGGSRGFGFVTFTDEQSAISCAGQRHMINGQTVEVKRATPRESDVGGRGGPARRGGRFGGGRGYGGRGGGFYGGMGGYGDDMAAGYGGGGYGRGYGGYGGYGMRGATPDYAGYGAPPAAAASMGMGAAGGYGGAGMRGAGYMGGAATGLDAGYGAGYGAAGGYDAGYGMGPGLEAPMASAPMMSAPMMGAGYGGAAMRYRPY